MSKHQSSFISANPPPPRAAAVVARLKIAEREQADLKLQIAERVLAIAEGKPGAREGLAALQQKLATLAFELQHQRLARELVERLDEEAIVAWKASVQTLDPEEIVAGISKDECPRFCSAGAGCCLSGAATLSGPCCHPLREGLMLTRYHENPQIMRVYSAACAKLGLRSNR